MILAITVFSPSHYPSVANQLTRESSLPHVPIGIGSQTLLIPSENVELTTEEVKLKKFLSFLILYKGSNSIRDFQGTNQFLHRISQACENQSQQLN